jgi:hypothetical protein
VTAQGSPTCASAVRLIAGNVTEALSAASELPHVGLAEDHGQHQAGDRSSSLFSKIARKKPS